MDPIVDLGSILNIFHFIGITGVGLYLSAYALLQLGMLRGSGYAYTILNMAAAGCVLISLIDAYNLSSFMIQVSWIAISIVGLTRMFLRNRQLRFSMAELEIARDALPTMPKSELRRLLDQGRWSVQYDGALLARQGVPVEDLIFIGTGSASVHKNGTTVAKITAGSFVGEITCLTGGPATATVVVEERMHCFMIPARALRAHLQKCPQALEHLERSFSHDLRKKLRNSAQTVLDLSAKTTPA